MFEALREPRFRRLWLAGLCINSARWMDLLILSWLALEFTDSPLMVGVAAFCRSAPMMLLGLFAGLLADRFHRGRLLIGVQILNISAALTLALVFGTGGRDFGLLVALATLLGVAWAVDFPARRTLLYTLVGTSRLTNAISLEGVSNQGTKMIGPVLGGVLLAQVGPGGGYLVLAALYLSALLILLSLAGRLNLPSTGTGESVLASLASGLREVRLQPAIMAVLGITVVMNVLVFPYQQMWSVFARDVLLVGPELLGLLIAADGFGALVGGLFLASRRKFSAHRQVFVGGSLAAAALVAGFALSPWYLLSFTIQVLAGMAENSFGTMQSTLVLLTSPERLRGRAMGILSVCIGTGPLGALWVGMMASLFGAPLAVATSALLGLMLMAPISARLLSPRAASLQTSS